VQSATEADISTFVRALEGLPGYADSSLDSRAIDTDSADGAAPTYTANITLNVTAGARSNRFGAADTGTAAGSATATDSDAAAETGK
jgi:hypothetical protein